MADTFATETDLGLVDTFIYSGARKTADELDRLLGLVEGFGHAQIHGTPFDPTLDVTVLNALDGKSGLIASFEMLKRDFETWGGDLDDSKRRSARYIASFENVIDILKTIRSAAAARVAGTVRDRLVIDDPDYGLESGLAMRIHSAAAVFIDPPR